MATPQVYYSGVTPVGTKVADTVALSFDNGSGTPVMVSPASPIPVLLTSSSVTITGPITVSNEVEIKNDSGNPVPVSGTFWQATQPVSGPATDAQMAARGYALDGTDSSGVVQLAGGIGIRGWLSGIFSKLSATLSIGATARVCLGTQVINALSAVTPASLTIPSNTVTAEIQADGGTIRMRVDAGAPSSIVGTRIDDGTVVTVDSVLTSVRLLAQSGTSTNVQISYFDRV